MRTTSLQKPDKEEIEQLLARLKIKPPVAGQLLLHFDAQGKLATVEMLKVIWR